MCAGGTVNRRAAIDPIKARGETDALMARALAPPFACRPAPQRISQLGQAPTAQQQEAYEAGREQGYRPWLWDSLRRKCKGEQYSRVAGKSGVSNYEIVVSER